MTSTTPRQARKTRRLLLAVIVLIPSVMIAAWLVARGRDGANTQRAQTGREMAGMEGMQGMEMSGDGSVRITRAQIHDFGITFDFVEERTLTTEVRTVGIVDFDETRVAVVSPRVGGFIERLYVDFTGKPVRRGQPLVEIYSPELVAAQEELLLAARLENSMGESIVPGVPAGASDLVRATRQRLRLWDISDAQIDEILRTGTARRALTLHAPVSGIVVEKNVLAGQAVASGEKIYTIADLSEVWVEAEVREADAGNVREGSAARVELGAFPGRPIAARIEYVYPTFQTETRTLEARIAIPNPEGRIKPGMFATVYFTTPASRALTVHLSALVRTGERQIVFVDMGGGEIVPHDVEIGRVAGDFAEVLAGLGPGQRVVTSAQFLLDSESNLAEVMKAMMGQMNTSDMRQKER
jgi:multidrug efflux pump subunit AcrA (membrane-fusion protein)